MTRSFKHPGNEISPVALITGGARRIGAAICEALHHAGFRVAIHCHQSQSEATALACCLNAERPDSAMVLNADLTQKKAAVALISQVIDWAGRLDLLVNNASIFKRSTPCVLDDASWDELFITNVKAPFWLSQTAYPFLSTTKGTIINITDIHAERPLAGYSVYCQSKAALALQTKALAREFAPTVRVNAIAPGAIAWPEQGNALKEEEQQQIIAKTPLKRHGEPAFIAKALLTLVENPFITGQILSVDGGRSL